MDVYRTPDTRFEHLADYAFQANYVDLGGLRMHYVDVGDPRADVVLMLHGEPTWSYLYRHMIPICVRPSQRVIAPDLIGFGKSDKPTRLEDYTYQRHVDWLTAFVRRLDLKRITLFCQDWGSLIGLRVAAEQEERFDRIMLANGSLPALELRSTVSPGNIAAFLAWRAFAQFSPRFPVASIVNMGCRHTLTPGERRAYEAPFPVRESLAGARMFPRLVPLLPNDPAFEANRAAWKVFDRWEKPFITAFSDGDPITRGFERPFQSRIPGARNQSHFKPHAGHFLQEDVSFELAQQINDFVDATPKKQEAPRATAS
jgi:haloalkane dehalogenase